MLGETEVGVESDTSHTSVVPLYLHQHPGTTAVKLLK